MDERMTERASRQYELIKVITTFLVVTAHAARMYTGEGVVRPYNESPFLAQLCDIIYAFHMPLYICVSGMVYGLCIDDYGKYEDTAAFLKNKFVRLMIPYLFFGIAYVAPVMVLFHFTDKSYFSYCVNGILLVRDSRHLWFLVVLLEIFCVCAVMKKQIQKKGPIGIFFVLIILSAATWKLPNFLQIKRMIHYLLPFYLGYVINRNYETVTNLLKKLPVMALMTVLFLLAYLSEKGGVLPIDGMIITSAAGIGLITGIVQHVNLDIFRSKWLKRAGKNGFGIYLFHPMIIYLLFYYFGGYDIAPGLLCGTIIFISYAASWILTEIIRKVPLKIVIGE